MIAIKHPQLWKVFRTPNPSLSAGFSLLEVLAAALILGITAAISISLGNSTNDGMQRSSLQAKTDSAIARRIEEIRH